MDKILIIDGGEKGNRIKEIINQIRNQIPKSILSIKYSTSPIDENGEYHMLNGFKLAFIHKSDNLDTNGMPIYNQQSSKKNIPLILFSGGIFGFKLINELICEINDNLLKQLISDYLSEQIKIKFLKPDFRFFAQKANQDKSWNHPLDELCENIRSIKHDYLNRISRILPEINTILDKIDSMADNINFQIDFDQDYLTGEMIKINNRLKEIYNKSPILFSNASKNILFTICDNILNLSKLLFTIAIVFKDIDSLKKTLNPVSKLIEETKILFEDLNNGLKNER
jgi:hypothetical protein